MEKSNVDKIFQIAEKLLHDEISFSLNGQSNKSLEQLKAILKELQTMKRVLSIKTFVPNYPRWIVDCWEYDELGNKLMELAVLYEKL